MTQPKLETEPKRSLGANSKKKFKYLVPSYYKFSEFRFDLVKLQQEAQALNENYQNVVESNRELCSNNHELVQSVYDHYEQISLTTYKQNNAAPLTKELCETLGKTAGSLKPLTKHRKYHLKTQPRNDYPELDERNYSVSTTPYINSYMKSCVESFGHNVMRVRLVKLKAGQKVDWHIDYDPSYAVRIIIPIFTNSLVINKTRRRNDVEAIHLTADGHPWFLNTGFSHSVENNGASDRVVLMFSLDAPELLDKLSKIWGATNP